MHASFFPPTKDVPRLFDWGGAPALKFKIEYIHLVDPFAQSNQDNVAIPFKHNTLDLIRAIHHLLMYNDYAQLPEISASSSGLVPG